MDDNEYLDWYDNRSKQLMETCCLCEIDGWSNVLHLVPKNNLVQICDEHTVCQPCTTKMISKQFLTSISCGESMKLFKCPYPYSNCNKTMKKSQWLKYIPITLQKSKKGFKITCTSCQSSQYEINPECIWTCLTCNRKSCGRCNTIINNDLENCKCQNEQQTCLQQGYSRIFSKHGFPQRRHTIHQKDIELKIKELNDHFPLVHVSCPSCSSLLFKSSACNDLYHCGNIHVCNFCQQKSFPWEKNGLPLSHWQTCPRWDHDINWFLCKEGECKSDSLDCTLESHKLSISELNKQRWKRAYSSISNKI